MRVKDIREVFNDYKKTSLLIASVSCDFKCETEGLTSCGTCQNSHLMKSKTLNVNNRDIVKLYDENIVVKSVIIAGLEPFLQFDEVYEFIDVFRETHDDEIVIFTGYYKQEIKEYIDRLRSFGNIIIKFGRYIENDESVYDEVLGVTLASRNQYAEKIS